MQKFLFIFAHPDDETVACGGTIKKLSDLGHQVKVITCTNGGAGQIMPAAEDKKAIFPDVGAMRQAELMAACELLGAEAQVLDFKDGQINNEAVWGSLLTTLIDEIDAYQPDVLVTFDHTGWYFHLDHVGVSIATTLAAQKAEHRPHVFFHVHYRPDGNENKWQYVYCDKLPLTHEVDVSEYKKVKLAAIKLHASQELNLPENFILKHRNCTETYQMVFCDQNGSNWLNNQDIFARSK